MSLRYDQSGRPKSDGEVSSLYCRWKFRAVQVLAQSYSENQELKCLFSDTWATTLITLSVLCPFSSSLIASQQLLTVMESICAAWTSQHVLLLPEASREHSLLLVATLLLGTISFLSAFSHPFEIPLRICTVRIPLTSTIQRNKQVKYRLILQKNDFTALSVPISQSPGTIYF